MRCRRGAAGTDFEMDAFGTLQVADDFEKIFGLGVAGWPEHAHEAFGRTIGGVAEFGEANGGVDEIAEDELAGFDIAGEEIVETFAEQGFAELRVALDTRADGFFEVFGQRHFLATSG
jgi:hypothetical protein